MFFAPLERVWLFCHEQTYLQQRESYGSLLYTINTVFLSVVHTRIYKQSCLVVLNFKYMFCWYFGFPCDKLYQYDKLNLKKRREIAIATIYLKKFY